VITHFIHWGGGGGGGGWGVLLGGPTLSYFVMQGKRRRGSLGSANSVGEEEGIWLERRKGGRNRPRRRREKHWRRLAVKVTTFAYELTREKGCVALG